MLTFNVVLGYQGLLFRDFLWFSFRFFLSIRLTDPISGNASDAIRPSSFFPPFTVVRTTQIFGIFKKKSNDVVTPFFTWNNYFNLKNEHSNSIEKNRNKNMNIFHSILYILLNQICECWLLTSPWGTRAYYSETSCDFFFRFFFSIWPTDPISGNAFDGKRRKKGGWPKRKKKGMAFGYSYRLARRNVI